MIKNKHAIPFEHSFNDTSMGIVGIKKVIQEHSVIHGSFNNQVNDSVWKIYENGVRILNNSLSTEITINSDKRLQVNSGSTLDDTNKISSRRSPLNSPTKGMIFSTAMVLPNPTLLSQRDFGLFNDENGIFFRLKSDGKLYGVVRNNSVEIIEEELIPRQTIDFLNKLAFKIQIGNIGFGGYKFLIEEKGTGHNFREVKTIGLPTDISLITNSLPISFQNTNLGESSIMEVIACDLTTESFEKESRLYNSIATPNAGVSLSTQAETPVMALQVNETFNGYINTVDLALRRITASVDAAAIVSVYVTNDVSTFVGTTWTNFGSHDNIKYAIGTTDLVWSPSIYVKKTNTVRIGINQTFKITNPDEDFGDFFLTAGDFLVVTLEAKNNNIGWATIEWGEEV